MKRMNILLSRKSILQSLAFLLLFTCICICIRIACTAKHG